ncbi:hypothetical protein AT1219_30304 [Vibrio alginolyticus]
MYKQGTNWNIGQRNLNITFHTPSFIQAFV